MITLSTQEAEEARTLLARLSVLLAPREEPAPPPAPTQGGLGPHDFEAAAARLRCTVVDIRTVDEVESGGDGFGPDGRCTVLYEGHVFSRESKHRFDGSHGGVSWPKWDKKRYPGGTEAQQQKANWDKIIYAAKLDRDAAYKAASYGRYQIMGFNHEACGYPDVHSFVAAMSESEAKQLDAFVTLILAWRLDDELREHQWAAFAERYNGTGQVPYYAGKLAAVHARLSA